MDFPCCGFSGEGQSQRALGALVSCLRVSKALSGDSVMKIKNSLKALMGRHRDNRMVRRKGRVYIINKKNPRFKARQG